MSDQDTKAGTQAAADVATDRTIYKAHAIGADVETQRSIQSEDAKSRSEIFKKSKVIDPPYDPMTLLKIIENSTSLPQNIESYVTNIDGLGHRFLEVIDLDSDESFERVREAMWLKRIREAEQINEQNETGEGADTDTLYPEDGQVQIKLRQLQRRARLQKLRVKSFFDFANPTGSFVQLRRRTREDLESVGNAFWEVLKNKRGEMCRFVRVCPTHVRLSRVDERPTMVDERVQVSPIEHEIVTQPRFFRRFAQVVHKRIVWFKEFGDPRIISSMTGKVYKDRETFRREAGPQDREASEMIHFALHKTSESYGVPRWIGNLLSVLGSRAADEVNFSYFDNKSIPALALLVSGGRLAEESVSRIETYIRDHIKGRENFHKILVIEADTDNDPMSNAEHPKLSFERLTDSQNGDALFQKYDERNIDKVGMAFRLPRLMRGDIRDFNRATANAAIRFVDEQVFGPERSEFDSWVNRVLLPKLGVTLWTFQSLGPRTRDPETVAEIIQNATKVGIITPNEARKLISDVLGVDLDSIDQGWANQPLEMTLAGFPGPTTDGPLANLPNMEELSVRLREMLGKPEADLTESEESALEQIASKLAVMRADLATSDEVV